MNMHTDDIDKELSRLAEMINNSRNIVFFGGAGVSTESNIPDFRSEAGIYKTEKGNSYPPEEMLSHSFFMTHTQDFFSFYKSKMIFRDARPNPAHYALAELERKGRLKAVITQNIDGLHQLAGSKEILELHGSVHRNYCMDCHKKFDVDYVLNSSSTVPLCDKCSGIVRPDVVLYEESLDNGTIMKAVNYISNADVLIVGGTSLVVYPAAGLIKYYSGKKLAIINTQPTQYDYTANIVIQERIGAALSKVMSYLA